MPPKNQPCKGKGMQCANAKHNDKNKQKQGTGSKKKDDEKIVKIWASWEAHEPRVSCKSCNITHYRVESETSTECKCGCVATAGNIAHSSAYFHSRNAEWPPNATHGPTEGMAWGDQLPPHTHNRTSTMRTSVHTLKEKNVQRYYKICTPILYIASNKDERMQTRQVNP